MGDEMNKSKLIILLLSVSALFLLTGCFGVDHNFRSVRNDLIRSTGDSFSTDVEFGIGSAGLSLAGMFVKDEDEEASKIIKEVSGVQIGVYKRHRSGLPVKDFHVLDKITERMNRRGYMYIVRSISHGEVTAIYVNKDPDKIVDPIFIISMDDNELNLVDVKGNIERIVEYAVKDKGVNIKM